MFRLLDLCLELGKNREKIACLTDIHVKPRGPRFTTASVEESHEQTFLSVCLGAWDCQDVKTLCSRSHVQYDEMDTVPNSNSDGKRRTVGHRWRCLVKMEQTVAVGS